MRCVQSIDSTGLLCWIIQAVAFVVMLLGAASFGIARVQYGTFGWAGFIVAMTAATVYVIARIVGWRLFSSPDTETTD